MSVALAAVACGSGSSEVVVEQSSDLEQPIEVLADGLIERLGSDTAAADALIISMDSGYSTAQILDGVRSGTLSADGSISAVSPAGSPLDLVSFNVEGEGEAGAVPRSSGDSQLELQLVAYQETTRTPIEELRANASLQETVGASATSTILFLLADDFTPADIIEILIFATKFQFEPSGRDPGQDCIAVGNELVCPNGRREQLPATDSATSATAIPSPSPSAIPDAGGQSDEDQVVAWCATWSSYRDTLVSYVDQVWELSDGEFVDAAAVDAVVARGRVELGDLLRNAAPVAPAEIRAAVGAITAENLTWYASDDESVFFPEDQFNEVVDYGSSVCGVDLPE